MVYHPLVEIFQLFCDFFSAWRSKTDSRAGLSTLLWFLQKDIRNTGQIRRYRLSTLLWFLLANGKILATTKTNTFNSSVISSEFKAGVADLVEYLFQLFCDFFLSLFFMCCMKLGCAFNSSVISSYNCRLRVRQDRCSFNSSVISSLHGGGRWEGWQPAFNSSVISS